MEIHAHSGRHKPLNDILGFDTSGLIKQRWARSSSPWGRTSAGTTCIGLSRMVLPAMGLIHLAPAIKPACG